MLKATRASALLLFALAGTAMANPDGLVNLPLKPVTEAPQGTWFLPQSEVNQLVYEVTSPSDLTTGGSRGSGGSAAVANDGNFRTYPPAQGVTYPIGVNGIAYGWIAFGPAPATPANFDLQVTFFDTIDMTVQAAAAPFYSTVLGTFRANNIAPAWGFVQWFQNPLALVDGSGNPITINFPDQNWGYEVKCFQTGTNNLWYGAAHGGSSSGSVTQIVPLIRGNPGVVNVVTGSSDPKYFRNDPVASDTTMGVNSTVLNTAAFNFGTAASTREVYIKLRADIPPPPAPNAFDIVTGNPRMGGVPDALDCAVATTVSQTFTLNPGEFRLYGFSLGPSGASVAADTYLDITTDGGFADTSMALYDFAGNRIRSDDDGGDLLNPALTFGHGRRPALGDSIQYDGRHGDLAGGGIFYIAVGGFGTAYGSSGFAVNPAAHVEFGDVTVTVNHNIAAASADCALPTPVAPSVDLALGLLPPGVTTASVAEVGFGQVRWVTFDTDYSIDGMNPQNFLDITTVGSANVVDSEIGLYDSLGNFIASNDDGCTGTLLSLLSLGDPGASPRPGIDACNAAGQDGSTLAAGSHYLCVGLFDTVFDVDGWQARSDSGSRLTVNLNFRTPSGCRADFNGDGNVDPDDLSDYITCFFTNAAFPGACPEADFNGDGGADPDDLSDYITLFFTVAGGGPCL